jgi:hypothetical protein
MNRPSRFDYLQWKDETRARVRHLTGKRVNSHTCTVDWAGLYASKLEPSEAAKRIVAQVRTFLNDLPF